MNKLFLVFMSFILFFYSGCSKEKLVEGQVSYQKKILFSVYDTNGAELNEKVKDAALKINFSRYTSDFGPGDIKIEETAGLPPCIYLGDMPLIYADDECAKGYGLTSKELAESWAETLRKSIFGEKPTEPFPEKLYVASARAGKTHKLNGGSNDQNSQAGGNLPMLVHIYADWCGACVQMAPELDAAEKEMEGQAVFTLLNVDDDQSKEMIAKYSEGQYIPQNIFCTPDGKVVKRVTGFMPKDEIISTLQSVK